MSLLRESETTSDSFTVAWFRSCCFLAQAVADKVNMVFNVNRNHKAYQGQGERGEGGDWAAMRAILMFH